MQKTLGLIFQSKKDRLHYLILLLIGAGIVFIVPKKGRFQYDFSLGKPWLHDDLQAPFEFAVLKDKQEIELEKKKALEDLKPMYTRTEVSIEDEVEQFKGHLKEAWVTLDLNLKDPAYASQQKEGAKQLKRYLEAGVLRRDNIDTSRGELVEELDGRKVRLVNKNQYNILENLQLLDTATLKTNEKELAYRTALSKSVVINVQLDAEMNAKRKEDALANILSRKGMIQRGEIIITRGAIVNKERFQKLVTLKQDYEGRMGGGAIVWMGYILLIGVILGLYGLYLKFFAPIFFSQTKNLIFMGTYLVLFALITYLVSQGGQVSLYLIPYSVFAVLVLAFFGTKVGVSSYLVMIMTSGLMASNSYEFVIVEMMAGMGAMLSLARVRYVSRFFVASLFVFLITAIAYTGLVMLKAGGWSEMQWTYLGWFGSNFLLSLLAYPLVYLNERIFGFVSEIRLLEYADTNHKYMKDLLLRAPGSFQHSLQVANLAEAIIAQIGGHALLTRVGALYHDIGKMYKPEIFIENAERDVRVLETYAPEVAAQMIIAHIDEGVVRAQEYGLPKEIIAFIRTHHGKTLVNYFYQKAVMESEGEVSEAKYRYAGPKPRSKEQTAVMLADSVEAAARAMESREIATLNALVDNIIQDKLNDGQLDESLMSFDELRQAKEVLKGMLHSIYHQRIAYPQRVSRVKP